MMKSCTPAGGDVCTVPCTVWSSRVVDYQSAMVMMIVIIGILMAIEVYDTD